MVQQIDKARRSHGFGVVEDTGEFVFEGGGLTRVLGHTYGQSHEPTEHTIDDLPPWLGDAADEMLALAEAGSSDERSPYDELGQVTLHKLLTAVRERLLEDDLRDFNLDAIIKDAGLDPDTAAQVRHNFKSGVALAQELIRRFYNPLFADLSEVAVASGDTIERLMFIGARHIQRAQKDPELYLVLVDLMLRRHRRERAHKALLAQLDDLSKQITKTMAALIAEGQMRNEIRGGNPVTLAMALSSALFGLINVMDNPLRLVPKGIYPDELARAVLQITIGGLRPQADDL